MHTFILIEKRLVGRKNILVVELQNRRLGQTNKNDIITKI
jgi:hypothetical protein